MRLGGQDNQRQEAALFLIAAAARHFLEEIWPVWQDHTSHEFNVPVPNVMSSGTCGRSSSFLVRVLDECEIEARVDHGWFRDAGSADMSMNKSKHAWVTADSWIIDITADQFGARPVVLTPHGDVRYENGMDTANEVAKARRVESIDALWGQWLKSHWRCCLTSVQRN